jgi:hypothetical protein
MKMFFLIFICPFLLFFLVFYCLFFLFLVWVFFIALRFPPLFCPCFSAHVISSLAYSNLLGTKRLG